MKSDRILLFGVAASAGAALIVILVPVLLRALIDFTAIAYVLALLEQVGKVLALVGVVVSSIALVRVLRHERTFSRVLLALTGIVVGVLALAPLLVALLLASGSSGIPR